MTITKKDFTLPNDPGARFLKFLSVPRGCQAIINVDGSQSAIVIVNPDDGRKPFIYYQEKEIATEIKLSRNEPGQP